MSKIVSCALSTVVLIGLNVFYFSVLDGFSASRWLCWGYVHLTYALLIASVCSVKAVPNGHVYAYPKIVAAAAYFFAALVVGVVLMMFANFESILVPSVVFLVFTGIFLKIYLTLMATEAASIANEGRDRAYALFVRRCAERVRLVKDGARGADYAKALERAYDAVRCADVTSIPQVAPIERQIEEQIGALEAVAASGAADRVEACAQELVASVRRRDAEIRLSH